MSNLTEEESIALSNWLGALLKEKQASSFKIIKGPIPNGAHDNMLVIGSVVYQLLLESVPQVAEDIIVLAKSLPSVVWQDLWFMLPDRIIGELMKAGAFKFLPPVIIKE